MFNMTENPLDTLQGAEEYKQSILGNIRELEQDIFNEGKKMPKALEKASQKGDWSDVERINHSIGRSLKWKKDWTDELASAKHAVERAGWIESGYGVIVQFLDKAFIEEMDWYRRLVAEYGDTAMTSKERDVLVANGELTKVEIMFATQTEKEAVRAFRLKMVERYYALISRVEKKAGKIVNAQGLQINQKGGIDGLVEGETATVHVETIPAWGTVQRFHYRTLVKEVKK